MKYNVRLCASTVKLKRYLSAKNVKEYFVLSKKKQVGYVNKTLWYEL